MNFIYIILVYLIFYYKDSKKIENNYYIELIYILFNINLYNTNPVTLINYNILFYITWKDLESYIIPNKALISYLFINIVDILINKERFPVIINLPNLLSFIIITIFFVLSQLKETIGMGDVKTFMVFYLIHGGDFFIDFLYILSLLLFLLSLLFVLLKREKEKTIPLAPIIFLAYFYII